MEIFLRYLPMLACPIIMGLMMWMMNRNSNDTGNHLAQQGEQSCHTASNNPSLLRKVWAMIQCCLNWKVLVGMAIVSLGLWLVAPGLLVPVMPVMLLLLCPLSMLLMMRGMNGSRLPAPTRLPELPAERRGGASSHE